MSWGCNPRSDTKLGPGTSQGNAAPAGESWLGRTAGRSRAEQHLDKWAYLESSKIISSLCSFAELDHSFTNTNLNFLKLSLRSSAAVTCKVTGRESFPYSLNNLKQEFLRAQGNAQPWMLSAPPKPPQPRFFQFRLSTENPPPFSPHVEGVSLFPNPLEFVFPLESDFQAEKQDQIHAPCSLLSPIPSWRQDSGLDSSLLQDIHSWDIKNSSLDEEKLP